MSKENKDQKSNEMVVTPWEVSGIIDYKKLVKKFGTTLLSDNEIDALNKYSNGNLHLLLRRGLFFSHRDFDWILKMLKKDVKFALYTGRGPSGHTHLGHLVPWIFTKWLQDIFDVELYFQMTDDEKFLFSQKLTFQETRDFAYENAKDVLAVGFNPEKTHFIMDSQAGPKFRRLATEIWSVR